MASSVTCIGIYSEDLGLRILWMNDSFLCNLSYDELLSSLSYDKLDFITSKYFLANFKQAVYLVLVTV